MKGICLDLISFEANDSRKNFFSWCFKFTYGIFSLRLSKALTIVILYSHGGRQKYEYADKDDL